MDMQFNFHYLLPPARTPELNPIVLIFLIIFFSAVTSVWIIKYRRDLKT